MNCKTESASYADRYLETTKNDAQAPKTACIDCIITQDLLDILAQIKSAASEDNANPKIVSAVAALESLMPAWMPANIDTSALAA